MDYLPRASVEPIAVPPTMSIMRKLSGLNGLIGAPQRLNDSPAGSKDLLSSQIVYSAHVRFRTRWRLRYVHTERSYQYAMGRVHHAAWP